MTDIDSNPINPAKEFEGRMRSQRVIPHEDIFSTGDDLLTDPNTSEESLDDDYQKLS
jgi:hypothetical protein